MKGSRDHHTKVKSDRERQIPYDITYMGNLKHDTKDPIYEPDTDSGMQRRDLRLPRGGGWGRETLGAWDLQM